MGKAVCLAGLVGCGKTAIVEHLARITGNRCKFTFYIIILKLFF